MELTGKIIRQFCAFSTEKMGSVAVENTKKSAHKIAKELNWDAYEVIENYDVFYTDPLDRPLKSKIINSVKEALAVDPHRIGEFSITLRKK